MFRNLLAIVVFVSASFAMADFDSAVQLYQKKDFSPAFIEFKRLAELGDHDAQFNLGAMYYRGENAERNPIEAYAWMSLAIVGGNANDDSRFATVEQIYTSFDAAQIEQANKRKEELAGLFGDAALKSKLAPVLAGSANESGAKPIKRVAPKYPAAMQGLRRGGMVDLIYGVGKDGVARDIGVLWASEPGFIESAISALKSWQFEPAMVDGRSTESYGDTLRITYFPGPGDEIDVKRTLKMQQELLEKAQQGDAKDQYRYAYFLEWASIYPKTKIDGRDANRWYFNSAASGNVKSQFALGRNLLYGKACTPDAMKSMYWLVKAANQNVPDAQYLLAVEMLSGARMTHNESAAITWLQKAAELKFINAQLKLAWIFATHPDKSIRNASLAKAYADKVSDEVFDQRTYYEVKAAVAAELGNFDEAIKWQKNARSEMEKYELPLAGADMKLDAYKAKRAWVEEL